MNPSEKLILPLWKFKKFYLKRVERFQVVNPKLVRRQNMKPKMHRVAPPVTRVVVMMAFLSALFLAPVNPSLAASDTKKAPAVRTSVVEHTEARIKELQSVLKITPAQEILWKNLQEVMREDAKVMDALTAERAEKTKTMNAVERMKFHSQITEARLNQIKKFIPPFEELYASMSDEQKKSADTVFEKGIMRKQKSKKK